MAADAARGTQKNQRELLFNLVLASGFILLAAGTFGIGWKTGCTALGLAILATCWRVMAWRN